jgi:hypothetical protein
LEKKIILMRFEVSSHAREDAIRMEEINRAKMILHGLFSVGKITPQVGQSAYVVTNEAELLSKVLRRIETTFDLEFLPTADSDSMRIKFNVPEMANRFGEPVLPGNLIKRMLMGVDENVV